MTLTKKILPSTIEVEGKSYEIQTDFQYFIMFSNKIKNGTRELKEYDFLYTNKIPYNRLEGYKQLYNFAYPHKQLPRHLDEDNSDEIILDYEQDADLIYSAFQEKYNIDLIDEDLCLHWYKFQALLTGLQNTKLNEVMKYRSYKANAKDPQEYRKQMQKLKQMWEIVPELSEEEKKAVEDFYSKLK